ncbi:MAG: hypothetical protein RL672_1276 [Actinomycetota bacterium]
MTLDKHQALKLGNREAIKAAALEMARDRGLAGFTVTELAERSGVSRRTFFNHFGSIDDAIHAGLRDLVLAHFEALTAQLEGAKVASIAELFERIEGVLLSANLDHLILQIQQIVGAEPKENRAFAAWLPGILSTVAEDLNELFAAKLPHESHLRINLFSLTLLQAIIASAEECAQAPASNLTPERWRALLTEALGSLRGGFGA